MCTMILVIFACDIVNMKNTENRMWRIENKTEESKGERGETGLKAERASRQCSEGQRVTRRERGGR